MATLAEILAAKQPEAVSTMKNTADKSDLSRLLTTPMSSSEIDALNQKPDVLQKMSQAAQGNFPSPETPSAPPSMASQAAQTLEESTPVASAVESEAPAAKSTMSALMEKLGHMPNEALAKLGPLGQRIMQSKAMTMANAAAESPVGKVAGKGVAALTIPSQAMAAKNAYDEGRYMDSAADTTGALSGVAAIAGSTAALPLGLASGAYAAGKKVSDMMGGEHAPDGVPSDPNAPPSLPPVKAPMQDDNSNIKLASVNPDKEDDSDADQTSSLPNGGKIAFREKMSERGSDRNPADAKEALDNYTKGFTQNTVANLKAVQDEQNANHQHAKFTNGMNLLGTSIAGLGSNAVLKNTLSDYYNDEAKDDHLTKDFAAQTEKEKDDPNSDYSQRYKAYITPLLQQMGMDTSSMQGASANQIKELMPFTEKLVDQQENRDSREEIAKQKSLDRADMFSMRTSDKKDANDIKRLDTVNKLITPGQASSRSPLGKDVANLNAIQNAKALLAGGNLDDIDSRQLTEVARVLDRVLSGGNATISGTEHLTPETAKIWIAKKLEYASSKRQGAGAGDFLQNNLHTFDREEELAKQRIQNTGRESLASYLDIAERNPEAWDKAMAEHNLLDVMGSKALKARASAGAKNRDSVKTGKDKDVQDYAKEHFNGDYEKAEAFLKSTGQL